jgi:hypothetical protein
MGGEHSADILAHLGADAAQVHAGDARLIRQPLDFLGVTCAVFDEGRLDLAKRQVRSSSKLIITLAFARSPTTSD